MAFQSIPQSTFASGFGAGVGQGLSEQLPKEIERGRLSEGLKNLGEGFEGLTPVEQISKLVSIPGMNAQTAMQFIPYIQQAQARKALAARAQQAQEMNRSQPSGANVQSPSGSYLERSQQPDYLVAPTPQSVDALANDLVQAGAYVDANEARAAAEQRLNSQYSSDQSQEQKKQLGKNLLDEFIRDTGTDISGEARKRFENQASDLMLVGGKNPQQMAKEMNDKLLDFSKAQTELKTLASSYSFAKRRKPVQESIQHTREQYKKLGILDQFEKDLQSIFDYTPEVASQFAFPTNQIPNVNQEFKKLKDRDVKPITYSLARKDLAAVPNEFVNNIINNWSPDVGIKGLARDLELKGYSGDDLLNKLRMFSGTEKFTPRQERELIKPMSSRRALGDVWLDIVETRKKV